MQEPGHARRCFGLFDGPKAPEGTPVYGSLRQRPTAGLTKRLNAARYLALAVTPHVPNAAAAAGLAVGAASAKRGAGQPTLAQLFKNAASPSEGAGAPTHGGGVSAVGTAPKRGSGQPTLEQLFRKAAKKPRA